MRRLLVMAAVALAPITACSSAHHGGGVPSLAGGGSGRAGGGGHHSANPGASTPGVPRPHVGYSTRRVGQLHAAAQCIREHGVPSYQDPVLTATGFVFTDSRSIQDVGGNASRQEQDALQNAIRQTCGPLFVAAGLQPNDESPAPPQLVRAGVRSAQCMRANGVPNMRDPDSETPFTPGHGFGIRADELPNNGALGKTDPTLRRALTACRSTLDAEIRASSLSSLAHD